jgi:hypothetical protein
MQRRDFFTMLAGVTALKLSVAGAQQSTASPLLERPVSGTPHKGKVLAAIQPHADDVAIICGGTVAKLIQEGYTGYMIRATNDDMGETCMPTSRALSARTCSATSAKWTSRRAPLA